jgi:hypothetical protein
MCYNSDDLSNIKVTETRLEPSRTSLPVSIPAHRNVLYIGQVSSPTCLSFRFLHDSMKPDQFHPTSLNVHTYALLSWAVPLKSLFTCWSGLEINKTSLEPISISAILSRHNKFYSKFSTSVTTHSASIKVEFKHSRYTTTLMANLFPAWWLICIISY